jgi:YggT family protein
MLNDVGHSVDAAIRALALLAVLAALLVFLTQWGVRRKWLQPFGWWPRLVRRWSDPLLRSIERRLAGAGMKPQDAPLWLLGIVLVVGLLAMAAERWLLGAVSLLASMQHAGPRAWLRLAVVAATSLVSLALILRVVGSWLGVGRFNRWMRPAYLLTNWIVEPIRRRMPAFGPLDLSPLIAYVAVLIFRSLLLSVL